MAKYDKDTKFYWLQLKEDFFKEDAIEWLEEQENGHMYSLFYLKLCLISLKSNGVLIRKVGNMLVPYDAKKLASMTKMPKDTVIVAMELLKNIGLVQILESGEIYLTQIENLVGSASRSALKKQQQRALKKESLLLESGQGVDKCPPLCPPKIEIENRDRNKEIYKDIVDYLNNKTGSSYKPTSKATKEHINARLKEGFTLEDFKTVIDKKTDEWKGTEFEQYLRPMTLFGTKFESYLNSKPKKKASDPTYTFEGMDDLDELF